MTTPRNDRSKMTRRERAAYDEGWSHITTACDNAGHDSCSGRYTTVMPSRRLQSSYDFYCECPCHDTKEVQP